MARPSPYPAELRERAVRMVAEIRPNYPTEWAAMKAVAAKLGNGAAETVRTWVRKAEVDAGQLPASRPRTLRRSSGCGPRTPSCDGPTRSRRRRRPSSRPSSTGRRNARSVHRRTPPGVRSRADLPCPDQPRTQDRNEHLLRGEEPHPQHPGGPRRGTQDAHQPRPHGQLQRLRGPEGVAAAPRRHTGGTPHRRPADARPRPGGRPTREEDPHHPRRRPGAGRGPAQARLHRVQSERAVGG